MAMKGVVFCEFLQFVEVSHGADMVDDIIDAAGVVGAYTAVGTYPHQEMVALSRALCAQTGIELPALLHAFGKHLASVFERGFSEYFARSETLFEFLASIDDHIHIEVRKLYPDAELPTFTVVAQEARQMTLDYHSPRHMEDLAAGLIEGTSQHFGTPVLVEQSALPDGGTRFRVSLC
jgi:hypothetical protein